ncbi:CHAT domain-containing protein [Phaeodactylibacter luteus]|uniref:CHAT domain-containing protein n=1 Tax=Phaeodactylibacter luteus TaxID=1564516 RepID=A0A5C6RL25_9BACT|nr:CHAT domain-containing tetratricopeptide repeat protein [Phaeodactylibacter luteus]TXB62654.1 CHAT domain-containing protein [Phaeodactylibacter luteus]
MKRHLIWALACLPALALPGPAWAQLCPRLTIAQALERLPMEAQLSYADSVEQCPSFSPEEKGLLMHEMGKKAYGAGEAGQAIEWTKRAIEYRREASKGQADEDLGSSLFNLGFFYDKAENYPAAMEALEASAQIQGKLGKRNKYRNTLIKLAGVCIDAGDYQRAARQLEFVIEDTQPGEEGSQAAAAINLGLAYSELQSYEQAIPPLQMARAYYQGSGGINEASSLLNLGKAYYEQGGYSQAAQEARQALQKLEALEDWPAAAKAGNLCGLATIRQGSGKEALQYLKQALGHATRSGKPVSIAQAYNTLGVWEKNYGTPLGANQAFEAAVATLAPLLLHHAQLTPEVQQQLAASGAPVDLAVYLYDYAEALSQDRQQLERALSFLLAADYLADEMRFRVSDETTKLFWRKEALRLYELGLKVCFELNDPETGFYFMEKSKAAVLQDALARSREAQRLPAGLLKRELKLEQGIAQKQKEAKSLSGQQKAALLQSALQQETALQQLKDTISQQYPQYEQWTDSQRPPSLSELQQQYLRPEDGILVHFLYGTKRLYALAASPTSASIHDLGELGTIQPAIANFSRYFAQSSQIANDPEGYQEAAYRLFQKLLGPVPLNGEPLITIIPSGPLSYLPFDALITAPGSRALPNAPYLAKTHIIRYGFSGALLMRKPTIMPEGKFYVGTPFSRKAKGEWAALPHTAAEAEAIARQYPALRADGQQACYLWLKEALPDAQILHLATHTASSPTGGEPYFALADTLVTLSQLYQLRTSSKLVVLSACQSQVGALAQGEGVLGLGRGFVYAGAHSVLASLWNLNDQSTSLIIARFYKELARGQDLARALSSAKRGYLEDNSIPGFKKSPYYWAGLTPYGKAVAPPPAGLPWLPIAGAGAALFGVLALSRKRWLNTKDEAE